jgi:hypothetical protein
VRLDAGGVQLDTEFKIQTLSQPLRVAPVTRGQDDDLGLGKLSQDLFNGGGGLKKGPSGPSEYDLNRGRAVDVLRADYPEVFTRAPDLSIFTDSVEFHAMGEKRLTGIKQYERVFNALRFLRRTTMKNADMTYRVTLQGEQIKVRFSSKLKMRDPITGLTAGKGEADLYIDGVSYYDLDANGKIYKHTLDDVEMLGGDPPVRVSQLVFALPGGGGAGIQLIPNFAPGRAFLRVLEAATPAGLGALFRDGAPEPQID